MSRNLVTETCIGCGVAVWAGLSDDYCARVVRIDPNPLSPFGEMLALLAGRGTFDLHREGEHWRLYVRDHWQIAGRPAGLVAWAWRCDVVTEHVCNQPLPAARSVYAVTRARPSNYQSPPF